VSVEAVSDDLVRTARLVLVGQCGPLAVMPHARHEVLDPRAASMLTYGWLVGEIVRRVSGESIGAFFAREFAAPLGLSTWIGLPASEENRVAALAAPTPADMPAAQAARQQPDEESRAAAAVMAAFSDPQSLTMRASNLNGAIGGWAGQNSPAFRAAEIPSVNGMTDARSLARLYAACVSPVDGCRALDAATIAEATKPAFEGPDAVIFTPTRYGLGFGLPTPATPLLGPSTFGHSGMGGALGFADAEHRVGFGYVMNKIGIASSIGPRAERLRSPLCLRACGPSPRSWSDRAARPPRRLPTATPTWGRRPDRPGRGRRRTRRLPPRCAART
jgi:CubicO group peptidase (beta-lactamase class C family)